MPPALKSAQSWACDRSYPVLQELSGDASGGEEDFGVSDARFDEPLRTVARNSFYEAGTSNSSNMEQPTRLYTEQGRTYNVNPPLATEPPAPQAHVRRVLSRHVLAPP
jgi:hypothetical protein